MKMNAFAANHQACAVFLILIILSFGCDAHCGGAFGGQVQEDGAVHSTMSGAIPDAGIGSSITGHDIVQANTLFCLDLYARLQDQKGNILFSPYSISAALAMTYAGAKGQTRSQMAEVMHFPMEQQGFQTAYSLVEKGIEEHAGSKNVRLVSANALWVQNGYRIHQAFLDAMEQYYICAFYQIDFVRSPEHARGRINSWVEDKTRGKITSLLKPQDIRADTTLVLSNALYFKGFWASQFNREQTREGVFHVSNDERVKVPMMNQQGRFRMIELPGLKILELPYAGEELSMFILLPEGIDGIGALETRLDAQDVAAWIKRLRARSASTIQVCLPVCKLEAEYQLGMTLSNMGMSLAFTGEADFSGISPEKDFFISDVVHKAFVEINEEGTEAAASTAVIMMKSAALPKAFIADHPFIFMIQENSTGSVLFFARIVNPQR